MKMKISEHALNILTAQSFSGIGKAWIIKNLSQPKPHYEEIVELLKSTIKDKEKIDDTIFLNVRHQIQANLEQFGENCDGVVAIGDKDFPDMRGKINKNSDKPVVLFYKGDLSLLQQGYHNIAVIGVLNPDEQTRIDEETFITKLSEDKNIVIVSGLAFGCDSIAHQQALKSNLKTVAILPSTLKKIIPAQNTALAREIVDNQGLLITEYWQEPTTQMAQNSRYVERDRLQALFSDLIVLSASYTPNSRDPMNTKIDSGSRHAMAKALEYHIPRAVIYSEQYQNNPKYDLNRQILQEEDKPIVINPKNFSEAINHILSKANNPNTIHGGEMEQGSLF